MHTKIFKDGDHLAMPYGSTRYPELERFFQIGTIRGFYLGNGTGLRRPVYDTAEENEARIAESLAKGERPVYAFPLGSSVTDSRAFQEKAAAERAAATRVKLGEIIAVDDGQRIHYVRIHSAPNHNLDLRPEVAGTAAARAEAAGEQA